MTEYVQIFAKLRDFAPQSEGESRSLGKTFFASPVQGSTMRPFLGLVNFVPAVAYHLCLNMSASFSQPGNGLLEVLCTHNELKDLQA